jgi:hypothetical protein
MARVKLDKSTVLVDAARFFGAMKKLALIAPTTTKRIPCYKAGLLEVSQRYNKLSLIVSDLVWGACVEMPCVCKADWRAVIDLDKTHVSGFCRGATLSDGLLEIRFASELVTMGGVPIEKQPIQDPAEWPDAWTREGMSKESRSDAFYSPVHEFMEALGATLPSVHELNERISCIHLRRQGKDKWRMESTDGHRAAIIERPGTVIRDLLIHRSAGRALRELYPLMEMDRILLGTFNKEVDSCSAGSIHARVGLKGGGSIEVAARNPTYIWKTNGKVDFPELDQVTPSTQDCWSFTVRPQELLEAARGVHDMRWRGKKDDAEEKIDDAATIVRDDQKPSPRLGAIYIEHPRTGKKWWIAEDSRWMGDGNGTGASIKPLRIGFNPLYLIDAAKAMGSAEAVSLYVDPQLLDPLMLDDGQGKRALVMPMRI